MNDPHENGAGEDFLRDQLVALHAQAKALAAQASALLRMYAAPAPEPPASTGPNYMGKED